MFRISLRCGNKVISKKICLYLSQQTETIYNQIRMCKSLTINDIKEILRIEVRKQIKHTQHFYLGTNVFDKEQTKQSLDVVSTRETKGVIVVPHKFCSTNKKNHPLVGETPTLLGGKPY